MSMMGIFREIPPPLLARLKADPSLVEEIVRGEAGSGADPLRAGHGAEAAEVMKRTVADSAEEILKHLPPDQRQMIDALPAEQRSLFVKRFGEEFARVTMGGKAAMSPTPKKQSSIAERDVGALLDIEKAWHGLHYLLTGNAEQAVPGAGEAVLGGSTIGPQLGYGPARLLKAEEVALVSSALSSLTRDALRARFDPKAMSRAQVYPGGWDDSSREGDEVNVDWLLAAFDDLRDFYQTVASRGSAILLYLR
jgi:hypothetical protein